VVRLAAHSGLNFSEEIDAAADSEGDGVCWSARPFDQIGFRAKLPSA